MSPPAPLPVRNGLNAARLRLPEHDPARTVLAHLLARFPDDAVRLRAKVLAEEVVHDDGSPVTASSPYRERTFVHLYRDPAPEVPVPFPIVVLHRDEHLLVVDKPHFLATTPRGVHVTETVLTRLRTQLALPELSPAHRLDRLTAGVLVLTVHRAARGPYQQLFDARAVDKTYEAVAPLVADLPTTVRSRIVSERGHRQAREVAGEPNAETRVELVASDGILGGYRLTPRTGRTHQLRVHLAGLGAPILGDDLYPEDRQPAGPDLEFGEPLQLLARSLALDDPFTGRRRRFASARTLSRWPGGGVQ